MVGSAGHRMNDISLLLSVLCRFFGGGLPVMRPIRVLLELLVCASYPIVLNSRLSGFSLHIETRFVCITNSIDGFQTQLLPPNTEPNVPQGSSAAGIY